MIIFFKNINGDIVFIYFLIFILKVIENAVSTLRMIFVSNGRKYLSALLQLVCSLIWIITTSMVVINITEDFIKVLFFALGCTVGSYIGSILEEKIALGSSIVICISTLDIMDDIRNYGYSLTSTKGTGLDTKNIIFIMTFRRKKKNLIHILKKLDPDSFIMSGAFLYEKNPL